MHEDLRIFHTAVNDVCTATINMILSPFHNNAVDIYYIVGSDMQINITKETQVNNVYAKSSQC